MARDELTKLYHELCETRFSFVPSGEHHLHDVYDFVQKRFTDLCDDNYLCSENCGGGHNSPEWQHRVRAALDYLKRTANVLRSAEQRSYWIFGQTAEALSVQQVAIDFEAPAPERVKTTTFRILRDTELARQIKQLHSHRCQICGLAIELADGSHYAEAHHIQPLGGAHEGPDVAGNIIVLCPNHHAMCDYGVIALSLDQLRLHAKHKIDPEYIDYHNSVICMTPSSQQ
jgi:hypothetical protein